MTDRIDILDERDPLGRPFAFSLGVHAAIAAAMLGWGIYSSRHVQSFGDPNSLGGAMGITPVSSIPLPQRAAQQNLVANETKSTVPSKPADKPQPKTFTKQELNAIELAEKQKAMRELEKLARNQKYQPKNANRPNQVYSSTGAAVSSPMFGGVPGSGGIGIGGVIGDRFGAYATILQQRIASHWNTSMIDPRIQNAKIAVVRFEIQRDGTVRNIRVLDSSGIAPLDNSGIRAVTEAAPFPPLPAAYEGSSAEIEVLFKLRR